EEARTHFASGVKLYDAKDYAAALDEFRVAYREKPSPGILRNIALCLRALKRFPEAIDTLEEMLARGGDTLDVRTRDAAQKAIDEMSETIAVVRLRIVLHAPGGASMPPLDARVDDAQIPQNKLLAVRVMPGEHTFRVTAPGYSDGL